MLAGLVPVLAILGCGGGVRPSDHVPTRMSTAGATTGTSTTGAVAFAAPPAALVTMRQYSPESLLWQTVSVKANGAAVLTTLIGEQVGAIRKSFQLPAPEAARLRRLVAGARSVRPPPPGIAPRDVLYTLHISRGPAENIQGPMHGRLAALVHLLSGLMFTYCC